MKNAKIMMIIGIFVLVSIGAVYLLNNERDQEGFTDDSPASDEENSEEMTDDSLADQEIVFDGMTDERLSAYHDNIRRGGPPVDGIPPIENPEYQSLEAADPSMENEDVVFIVEVEEGVFLYPQRILVWHEIVNETFGGEKMSITYCPLTGSAIGYKGNLQGIETNYGTSGKLINSNLVMYDRETDSYIPQILGIAVEGELKGQRLEEFPVLWSTWGRVKEHYDTANVLTERTGFLRDYNRDPYGSYVEGGGYYFNNALVFPVMYENDRFEKKEVMIAGRVGDKPFAILKSTLAEEHSINFTLGERSLVAMYDEDLDTARVYMEEDGELIFVNSYDVMWFAWYAFFPETMVYE